MKISNRPSVSGPAKIQKTEKVDRQKASSAYGSAHARTIEDTVEILGIPSAELTPKVRSAITALMSEVDRLRTELSTTNNRLRELEDLADLDTLLPIANRRAFVRELNRMISFAERYGTPSTLIYIDMNDLKKINDTYGHDAGDAALKHIARTIKDNIRGSDTLARLGGDEFGVLLAHAGENSGTEKAVNLSEIVSQTPFHLSGETHYLNYAYGTYTFRGDDSAEGVLDQADRAMYERKKAMKSSDMDHPH